MPSAGERSGALFARVFEREVLVAESGWTVKDHFSSVVAGQRHLLNRIIRYVLSSAHAPRAHHVGSVARFRCSRPARAGCASANRDGIHPRRGRRLRHRTRCIYNCPVHAPIGPPPVADRVSTPVAHRHARAPSCRSRRFGSLRRSARRPSALLVPPPFRPRFPNRSARFDAPGLGVPHYSGSLAHRPRAAGRVRRNAGAIYFDILQTAARRHRTGARGV